MAGQRKKTVEWRGKLIEGTPVLVENQVEPQSTYNLEDGTQIRMRTVVMEVVRLDGHYNAEGDTIYLLKSQNLMTTNVPEKYRRPRGA